MVNIYMCVCVVYDKSKNAPYSLKKDNIILPKLWKHLATETAAFVQFPGQEGNEEKEVFHIKGYQGIGISVSRKWTEVFTDIDTGVAMRDKIKTK